MESTGAPEGKADFVMDENVRKKLNDPALLAHYGRGFQRLRADQTTYLLPCGGMSAQRAVQIAKAAGHHMILTR